jgi:putative membrane protein
MERMLKPDLAKNDKWARVIIYTVSVIVFLTVVVLSRVTLKINVGFDVHIFAVINAIINSLVAVFLLLGLMAAKQKKFILHKKIMLTAIILSVLFLLSYIAHHLLAGDTKFGDINHDGILSIDEKLQAGNMRFVYLIVLLTHIPLAAIILPFILFTAYRALIGEYDKHKKIVRFTWPIWFYVAISGVIVYWMINPYYN